MLKYIERVVNSLFCSIKAVITFFEQLIPIVFRAIYALSPFILLTLTVYVLWGKVIAILVLIGSILFIIIGVVSQYSSNKEGELSGKVKNYIFLINIVMLATIVYADNWVFVQNGKLHFNTPIHRLRAEKLQREKDAVRVLNAKCAKGDVEDIISSIKEITIHNYKSSIPTLELYLTNWYSEADKNKANFRVSLNAIDSLISLQSNTSCKLLQKVADKSVKLNQKASEAIKQLCNS